MNGDAPSQDREFPDIPSTWAWAKIADLSPEFQNGLASRGESGGFPTVVLRLADIIDGKISLGAARSLPVTQGSASRYSAEYADILAIRVNGSSDIVGRFIPCEMNDIVYCDHFIRLRINSEVLNHRYLVLLGSSRIIRRKIERLFVSTAGQKTVNQRHLSSLTVPIPPRREQDRIVAAIEEQFSRLDAGVAALERARRNVKRLRSAVWEAAIGGTLIPPDYDAPSLASDLPPAAVVETNQHLPQNWVITTVGALAHVTSGATPLRSEERYWKDGAIPWVTSTLVNQAAISAALEYITPQALEETSVKLMPKGTLLVAMYGEGQTRGRCSELLIEATTNQACAAIVVNEAWEFAKPFLKLVLIASYEANRRLSSGGVQPNLSVGTIKRLSVPLPPKTEQRRILEQVERQLSLIDELDVALKHALIRAGHLRSATLADAFSGTLVPQDSQDEPASMLLKRIASECMASNSQQPRRL